ncbi:MAG: GTP-binding protein [Bacteroidota bacterium]
MKILSNDIVLRPRFKLELPYAKEVLLKTFERSAQHQFLIKRLDEHLFIKFKADENHFWSPQLHLEVVEKDLKNCTLFGVFGPNPSLWTLFMFLHFGAAILFIMLGIWTYSSATLGQSYGVQLGGMVFITILWFVLYALGRMGKRKGRPQMHKLYQFMLDTLAV